MDKNRKAKKRVIMWGGTLNTAAIAAGLLLSSLLLMGGNESPDLPVSSTPKEVEEELLFWINQERVQRGLHPLESHETLKQIARHHSEKMADEKKLSHEFPGWELPAEKMARYGLYFNSTGENIASSSIPVVPRWIHESLMNSPMHRMNILFPEITHCGIAAVERGKKQYITQEFARVLAPELEDAALSRVENFVSQFFKKEYLLKPIIFPEHRKLSRVLAFQYLHEFPLELDVSDARYMMKIFAKFPDLDLIIEWIEKQISPASYYAYAIGLVWGRSKSYPGGTYSVCLLLAK